MTLWIGPGRFWPIFALWSMSRSTWPSTPMTQWTSGTMQNCSWKSWRIWKKFWPQIQGLYWRGFVSLLLYNVPCMYFRTLVIWDSLAGWLMCMYVRLCIEKPTGWGYISQSRIDVKWSNLFRAKFINLCVPTRTLYKPVPKMWLFKPIF